MTTEDRHLQLRDRRCHDLRRVPSRLADLDDRGMIRVSLKTRSRDVARMRRDTLAEADEHICKCWTETPDQFKLNPFHHAPGLNT